MKYFVCVTGFTASITVTAPIYSMYVAIAPLELRITWDDGVRIIVRILDGFDSE